MNFEIYDWTDTVKVEENKRWPIVYLLRGGDDIYIGETTNIYSRFFSHAKSSERGHLKNKKIVYHKYSNKSAAYLIESDLINRAFADKSYNVLNTKRQSNELIRGHDFYNKNDIKGDLEQIWNHLKKEGIFKKDYKQIENEELFKYSPWKEFNENQSEIIDNVTKRSINNLNSYIEGEAGTGKTLLIIRIAMDMIINNPNVKVGIYSAKKGNSATFRRVIKEIDKNIKKQIVILDNIRERDLSKVNHILIDEAQRMRRWHAFSNPEYFKKFKKNELADEFAWIKQNKISYSLFYDGNQSISSKDAALEFEIDENNYFKLESQFRVKSGDDWISFVKELLGIIPKSDKIYNFDKYDFRIFDSKLDLYETILNKNNLASGFDNKSRLAASLNYDNKEWKTKNIFKTKELVNSITNYDDIDTDFVIGDYKLVWNKFANYNDWLEQSDVTEVGCVHTLQGRDLNYIGVLFADDLKIVDGKISASKEVINAYFVLLTRGILGTGIYVPNEEVKDYIKAFVKNSLVKK